MKQENRLTLSIYTSTDSDMARAVIWNPRGVKPSCAWESEFCDTETALVVGTQQGIRLSRESGIEFSENLGV